MDYSVLSVSSAAKIKAMGKEEYEEMNKIYGIKLAGNRPSLLSVPGK